MATERMLPALISDEFTTVTRYWDNVNETFAAKITPGEYYVTNRTEMITTVLGSCISACVRDHKRGIGGMNHFMLPHSDTYAGDLTNKMLSVAGRYGNVAMERLVNCILSHGGRRNNLEFKVFGGANVLDIDSEVGHRNILFITEYMRLEGLSVEAYDLGGELPRKINYFPVDGRVMMKRLRRIQGSTLQHRERAYYRELDTEPVEGQVTLFNT